MQGTHQLIVLHNGHSLVADESVAVLTPAALETVQVEDQRVHLSQRCVRVRVHLTLAPAAYYLRERKKERKKSVLFLFVRYFLMKKND